MSPRGLAQPLAPVAGTHVCTPRGGTLMRKLSVLFSCLVLVVAGLAADECETTGTTSESAGSTSQEPTETPRATESSQDQEPTALPDPTATPAPQTGPVTINPGAGGTENLGDGLQYGALLETDGPEPEMGTCFASFTVGDPPLADRIAGHIEITEPTSLRIPEDGLLEGEFEPIWQFNTNFCQPWRIVEAGIDSGDSQERLTVEGQRMSEAAATAVAEAEERRKGFHCLSPWDGNHDGLEALIRDNLNDPGSMDTIQTRITPVDEDGHHTVALEFTALNALGGRVRLTAYGQVNNESCEATLTGIE